MRLIPAVLFALLPATAFANCAAEMRICTFFPAGGDVLFTQPCSFTQCASVDTVFDYFKFDDGSFVRVDYTPTQTILLGQLSFAPVILGPQGSDPMEVTGDDTDPDQRRFESKALGEFYTDPCDGRCAGIDAVMFGN
jgi:hypothetical protein